MYCNSPRWVLRLVKGFFFSFFFIFFFVSGISSPAKADLATLLPRLGAYLSQLASRGRLFMWTARKLFISYIVVHTGRMFLPTYLLMNGGLCVKLPCCDVFWTARERLVQLAERSLKSPLGSESRRWVDWSWELGNDDVSRRWGFGWHIVRYLLQYAWPWSGISTCRRNVTGTYQVIGSWLDNTQVQPVLVIRLWNHSGVMYGGGGDIWSGKHSQTAYFVGRDGSGLSVE